MKPSSLYFNSWSEWSFNINRNILDFMHTHNMTHNQVAQRIGCNPYLINIMENGEYNIKYTPYAINIIEERLNVNTDSYKSLSNHITFLHASPLTNFRYKLSHNLSQEKVDKINIMLSRGHADIQGRVNAIIDAGAALEFDTINPNKKGERVFLENLILIDSSMPEILAHLLVLSYTEDSKMLNALTDKLTHTNPLKFPMRTNTKYYEAKVKRFITDVALGMLPGQPWEASHQAAGVLVVTENGNIDCYHIIYKASLEDYLYDDLKFETPSASRHGFGVIETGEDGNQYFTLNLQLRFIK